MSKLPTLLAIDPGNRESAFVRMSIPGDDSPPVPLGFNKIVNEDMLDLIEGNEKNVEEEFKEGWGPFDRVCIEYPFPRGQLPTTQLFDTVAWIGEIRHVFQRNHPKRWLDDDWKVDRGKAKYAVCLRTAGVTDSHIRQTLIDIYGGEDIAVGGRKCRKCKGKGWRGRDHDPCDACPESCGWETKPGPLHGMTRDMWAALAVGYTWIKARRDSSFSTGM